MISSTHTELQTTKDEGINFERLLDSLEAASLFKNSTRRPFSGWLATARLLGYRSEDCGDFVHLC